MATINLTNTSASSAGPRLWGAEPTISTGFFAVGSATFTVSAVIAAQGGGYFVTGMYKATSAAVTLATGVTLPTTTSGSAAFVYCMSAKGVPQWAAKGPDTTFTVNTGTALDTDGTYVYVVGTYKATSTYTLTGSAVTLPAINTNVTSAAWVAAYTVSSGVPVWARGIPVGTTGNGGTGYGVAVVAPISAVAVSISYATSTAQTVDTGVTLPATTNATTNWPAVIAFSTSTGTSIWSTVPAAPGIAYATIYSASSSLLYLAANINSGTACNFGNSVTLASMAPANNAVLAAYSVTGSAATAQWAARLVGNSGASMSCDVRFLALDPSGNVFVAGVIVQSNIPYGPSVPVTGVAGGAVVYLPQCYTNASWVGAFTASGQARWAASQNGQSANNTPTSLIPTADGGVVLGISAVGAQMWPIYLGNGVWMPSMGGGSTTGVCAVRYSAAGAPLGVSDADNIAGVAGGVDGAVAIVASAGTTNTATCTNGATFSTVGVAWLLGVGYPGVQRPFASAAPGPGRAATVTFPAISTATQYEVWRSNGGAGGATGGLPPGTKIATFVPSTGATVSFVDATVSTAAPYFYRVRAVVSTGAGAVSTSAYSYDIGAASASATVSSLATYAPSWASVVTDSQYWDRAFAVSETADGAYAYVGAYSDDIGSLGAVLPSGSTLAGQTCVVAKFSTSGAFVWGVKGPMSIDTNGTLALAPTSDGGVIAAGRFAPPSGYSSLGNGVTLPVLFSSGSYYYGAWVARYSAAGVPQWAASWGQTNSSDTGDAARSLALSPDGATVYVAGQYGAQRVTTASFTIGGTQLSTPGVSLPAACVVALNASTGAVRWAVSPFGAGAGSGMTSSRGMRVATDAAGAVYVAATYQATQTVPLLQGAGGVSVSTTSGQTAAALMKLTSSGSAVTWARYLVASGGAQSNALAMDTTNGRLFWGGQLNSATSTSVGGVGTSATLPPTDNMAGFLTGVDPATGNVTWGRSFDTGSGVITTGATDAVTGAAADGSGGVVAVVMTGNPANGARAGNDLGNGVVVTAPTMFATAAAYLARFDGATGSAQWATPLDTGLYVEPWDVFARGSRAYVAGGYSANGPWSTGAWALGTNGAQSSVTLQTTSVQAPFLVKYALGASPATPPVTTGVAGGVLLTWAAASGAASYQVWRASSTGGAGATQIASPAASPYTDTGAAAGTTYYYALAAVDSTGAAGPLSAYVAGAALLAAPATLTATDGVAAVTLSWAAVAGAHAYTLFRDTTALAAGTTQIAAGISTTSTTDNPGSPGTLFYYAVEAFDGTALGGAATAAGGLVPAAPAPSATGGSQNITVSWAVATGATGYLVYREASSAAALSDAHSGANVLATLNSGATTSYVDTPPPGAGSWYYVVVATSPAGSSPVGTPAAAALTGNTGLGTVTLAASHVAVSPPAAQSTLGAITMQPAANALALGLSSSSALVFAAATGAGGALTIGGGGAAAAATSSLGGLLLPPAAGAVGGGFALPKAALAAAPFSLFVSTTAGSPSRMTMTGGARYGRAYDAANPPAALTTLGATSIRTSGAAGAGGSPGTALPVDSVDTAALTNAAATATSFSSGLFTLAAERQGTAGVTVSLPLSGVAPATGVPAVFAALPPVVGAAFLYVGGGADGVAGWHPSSAAAAVTAATALAAAQGWGDLLVPAPFYVMTPAAPSTVRVAIVGPALADGAASLNVAAALAFDFNGTSFAAASSAVVAATTASGGTLPTVSAGYALLAADVQHALSGSVGVVLPITLTPALW
jgi:hypothetical protein